MAPLTSYPPLTQVELVTDVVHGVSIPDPYRWLEDQNSSRTRKWLEEQTLYTHTYLDTIPRCDIIRKRVSELLSIPPGAESWNVRARDYFLKRHANNKQPVIIVSNPLLAE